MTGGVSITVKPRGPLVVRGPVVICDPEGREIPAPAAKQPGLIKLCRCGHSSTKPFCDGSHRVRDWPEPASPDSEAR